MTLRTKIKKSKVYKLKKNKFTQNIKILIQIKKILINFHNLKMNKLIINLKKIKKLN